MTRVLATVSACYRSSTIWACVCKKESRCRGCTGIALSQRRASTQNAAFLPRVSLSIAGATELNFGRCRIADQGPRTHGACMRLSFLPRAVSTTHAHHHVRDDHIDDTGTSAWHAKEWQTVARASASFSSCCWSNELRKTSRTRIAGRRSEEGGEGDEGRERARAPGKFKCGLSGEANSS